MISPDEKRAFVESILQDIETKPSKEIQLALYDFLMKDTQGGKLYKYRTVTDNNLDCLQNGTLYCATPDTFNDPFDSRIGVTFTSLYDALSEKEQKKISDIFESVLLVLKGLKSMNDTTEDENRIIRKILSSQSIMTFIAESSQRSLSLEDIKELLLQNGSVIIDLLEIITSDEIMGKSLPISNDMLSRLIKRMPIERLVESDDNDYSLKRVAELYGIQDDVDEISLLSILAKVIPLPEEGKNRVFTMLESLETNLNSRINQSFRIGCLATDCKNRLMWSHYTNCYQGFCVEYDLSAVRETDLSLIPLPVIYSDKRPQIPWENTINLVSDNQADMNRKAIIGMLTKDKEWQYENEWRIFVPNSENGCIQMPPITAVYLGPRISTENREKIKEITDSRNIVVRQISVDRGEYALHVE